MLDELSRHKIAYIMLFFILLIHVVLFFTLWPSRMGLRVVAGTLASSYFLWGIFTHVKSAYLTKAIVKEYLFAALLAGAILFFLTI